MFGYVTVNKPEIKFKDFDMYRSFYCGLCRELRERYGIPGQISLTYDMTFVVLLLSGVYEPPTQKGTSRCAVHPLKPQPVRRNAITEYCADMNVILSYYKCMTGRMSINLCVTHTPDFLRPAERNIWLIIRRRSAG